jgi:hypothetical protein
LGKRRNFNQLEQQSGSLAAGANRAICLAQAGIGWKNLRAV